MSALFNILGFFFRFLLGCRDRGESAAERNRRLAAEQQPYEDRRIELQRAEIEYSRLAKNDLKSSPFRDFPKEKGSSLF